MNEPEAPLSSESHEEPASVKIPLFPILLLIVAITFFIFTCQAKGSTMNTHVTSSNPSVVYFTKDISAQGIQHLMDTLHPDLPGKVALKIHFGEDGNQNYLRPELVKDLVLQTHATLVETNVLYGGMRGKTDTHVQVAHKHGYDFAPIDILDSEGEMDIPHQGKHYQHVFAGSHLKNYDSFIIVSHFKGHMASGFGGAIKNVSMGMASFRGKMALHANARPNYQPAKCVKDGICVRECPVHAISLNPLHIDPKRCISCGKCIQVCPVHAFQVPWGDTPAPVFLERLVEYADGITKGRKVVYINVLVSISPDCDCFSRARKPFVQDIGILASQDIVAIDKASLDLVNQMHHCDDSFLRESGVSGNHQLEYAQQVGLGSMHYQLVDIDKK